MSRPRRFVRLASLVLGVSVGACSLWSDFDGLDDARPAASSGDAGAAGAGGGGAGGQGGGGAATGGAGGDGGAECKPVLAKCAVDSECCAGFICSYSTFDEDICCGVAGSYCHTSGAEDCCRGLECNLDIHECYLP